MNINQTEDTTRQQKSDPTKSLDVDVKIYPTPAHENTRRLATASVTLGGCFAIRGIAVMDSEKGAFVSMPQRKDSRGDYHDICFPVTSAMRETLHTAVLNEYQKTVDRTFNRAGQSMEKRASVLENLNRKQAETQKPQAARDAKPVDKGAR